MIVSDLPNRNEIRAVYSQGVDAVIMLVESLNERIRALEKRQQILEDRIRVLEDRLVKDSHNSHKPPASDSYSDDGVRKTRSLRRRSGKKPGGQEGHQGTTLRQVENPDEVVPLHCKGICACGRDLSKAKVIDCEKRQVFDVPEIRPHVTEYCADIARCGCGDVHTAEFPAGINGLAQYGVNAKATATYFMNYQLIPFERTTEIFENVFHLPLSEGTLNSTAMAAYASLAGTDAYIGQQVLASPVVRFDESGLYIGGERYWLHEAGTEGFTAYRWHFKRGQDAMDDIGILPRFTGTAVHDDLPAYLGYENCRHALCNVHHLRDLTFLFEQHHERWAGKMKDLLLEIKQAVERSAAAGHCSFRQSTKDDYATRYMAIIAEAKRSNPLQRKEDPSRRGRTAQSKSRNLLERLSRHRDKVLAFMNDFTVPFDNNLAERDIRMIKVKQKISGCFRSAKGADAFCRIRSFISTVKKQGRDILTSIQKVFENTNPSANLLAP